MKMIINLTTRILGLLCIVLFTLLVLTTTWQVFSRLVLNSPVTWSEELAKMLFVWLSFIGSALVYGERGHMAMEFVARKFGHATERVFALWTHIAAFALGAIILIWGGINASRIAWTQNLTALPVSIGLVYVVLPISGLAIVLYAIYHLTQIAHGKETNFPVPESELVAEQVAKIEEEAAEESLLLDEMKGDLR